MDIHEIGLRLVSCGHSLAAVGVDYEKDAFPVDILNTKIGAELDLVHVLYEAGNAFLGVDCESDADLDVPSEIEHLKEDLDEATETLVVANTRIKSLVAENDLLRQALVVARAGRPWRSESTANGVVESQGITASPSPVLTNVSPPRPGCGSDPMPGTSLSGVLDERLHDFAVRIERLESLTQSVTRTTSRGHR